MMTAVSTASLSLDRRPPVLSLSDETAKAAGSVSGWAVWSTQQRGHPIHQRPYPRRPMPQQPLRRLEALASLAGVPERCELLVGLGEGGEAHCKHAAVRGVILPDANAQWTVRANHRRQYRL